jgi:hypothetical protein
VVFRVLSAITVALWLGSSGVWCSGLCADFQGQLNALGSKSSSSGDAARGKF